MSEQISRSKLLLASIVLYFIFPFVGGFYYGRLATFMLTLVNIETVLVAVLIGIAFAVFSWPAGIYLLRIYRNKSTETTKAFIFTLIFIAVNLAVLIPAALNFDGSIYTSFLMGSLIGAPACFFAWRRKNKSVAS